MDTELIVAVNEAEDEPEATAMLPGTVTALLLLARATLRPLVGAAELSETVHAVVPAPVNDLLLQENALIDGVRADPDPVKLIDVVFDVVPCVAVRVTTCDVLTLEAVAAKLALVAPAGTETDAGTLMAALLLARLTDMPPLGADPLRVTLQESAPARIMDELAQVSPDRETEETEPFPCNFTVLSTRDLAAVVALTLSCPMESVADPGS